MAHWTNTSYWNKQAIYCTTPKKMNNNAVELTGSGGMLVNFLRQSKYKKKPIKYSSRPQEGCSCDFDSLAAAVTIWNHPCDCWLAPAESQSHTTNTRIVTNSRWYRNRGIQRRIHSRNNGKPCNDRIVRATGRQRSSANRATGLSQHQWYYAGNTLC
jgi:hypothetical protein